MYYGFGELIKHGVSYFYTKLFWPKARLVRLPIYARTRKNIIYGSGLTTGYACRFAAVSNSRIVIGKNVTFGDYVQLQSCNEIIIGDHVLFASRIYVGDSNHGIYSGDNQTDPAVPPNDRPLDVGRIRIGNNAWIGTGAAIVGNVEIGEGTVIGANSVVTHDLDSYSIYAGAPAKKLKEWNPETQKWEPISSQRSDHK